MVHIKSYAKINLCLDVLGKSGRGQKGEYHRIGTVFQQVGLYDDIFIKEIPGSRIIIECDDPAVPKGQGNTVYKAASLMRKVALRDRALSRGGVKGHSLPHGTTPAFQRGLLIKIKKRIPVASGLGGAASNAAAVLKALNTLWKLKLSPARLRKLGAEVGMDVPFFIEGGTASGTHFGEKITTLPRLALPPLLIVMDGDKRSTASMYSLLDLKRTGRKKDLTGLMVATLRHGESDSIRGRKSVVTAFPAVRNLTHNDFETLLCAGKMAKTRQMIRMLLCTGADVVHICGSGPAVYAFYKNGKDLEKAYETVKGKVPFAYKSL